VQNFVERQGFSVVRQFVGHGMGRALHQHPEVPNFGAAGSGDRLSEGMAIAIEPMVTAGHYNVVVASDGWTAKTRDGSLSAHFEHTIVITKKGPLILTRI
jgi:methionyl aminopeptidase